MRSVRCISFFFSSRRRHTRYWRDWSSDVCSSDLLGNNWVRAVAMGTTDGLKRGTEARDTGAPISVPVGEVTLGRIFNVLGQPIDEAGSVTSDTYYPIHRPAPSLEEQSTQPAMFETGVKVIDLIAPRSEEHTSELQS